VNNKIYYMQTYTRPIDKTLIFIIATENFCHIQPQ